MTCTASLKSIAAFAILLAVPAAQAETCKYEDAEGRIIYSNIAQTGLKKVMCFEPMEPVPPAKKKRSNQGPTDFPKVDAGTQKTRDEARRKILVDELSQEELRLGEARKALDEERRVAAHKAVVATAQDGKSHAPDARADPKRDEKLRDLQGDVTLHERNVAALKKELGNLK
jgi:hypothetical protein